MAIPRYGTDWEQSPYELLKVIGEKKANENGLPKEYSEIEETRWSWIHGSKQQNHKGKESFKNVLKKYGELRDSCKKLGLWPIFEPDSKDTPPVMGEVVEKRWDYDVHIKKKKYSFKVASYVCIPERFVEILDSLSGASAKNVNSYVERKGRIALAHDLAELIDGSKVAAGLNTMETFKLNEPTTYERMTDRLSEKNKEMRDRYQSRRISRMPLLGRAYSRISERRIRNYDRVKRNAIDSLRQKYAQGVTAWQGRPGKGP